MSFVSKITCLCSLASLGLSHPRHDERELLAKPETISQHEANSGDVPSSKRVMLRDLKGLSEMENAEIIRFVKGKRLSNTPDGEFVGRLFVEEFDQSGIWINTYNDRPSMRIHGTWNVKNNQLCVSRPKIPEQCRPIFVDRNTDEVWMFDYTSRSRTIVYKIFVLN